MLQSENRQNYWRGLDEIINVNAATLALSLLGSKKAAKLSNVLS